MNSQFRLRTQVHFVIASDDIDRARELFPMELHPLSTFLEERHEPLVDMTVLALCDHTVLTVGSFGWWAAFLRECRRLAFVSDIRPLGSNTNDWHWVIHVERIDYLLGHQGKIDSQR